MPVPILGASRCCALWRCVHCYDVGCSLSEEEGTVRGCESVAPGALRAIHGVRDPALGARARAPDCIAYPCRVGVTAGLPCGRIFSAHDGYGNAGDTLHELGRPSSLFHLATQLAASFFVLPLLDGAHSLVRFHFVHCAALVSV